MRGTFAIITLTTVSKYDGLHTIDLTAYGENKEDALESMNKYAMQYLDNPVIIDYRIENIKLTEAH